jgi:hypothetical protein
MTKIKAACCAILVLICFVGREAAAQTVITNCKSIVGKTLVRPNSWFEDAFTDGSVTVVRQGAGYDLIIKDALATFTALEDGARIIKLEGNDDKAFTLAVSYPLGQVEVYRFKPMRRAAA